MDIEKIILSLADGNIEGLEILYNHMRVNIFGIAYSIICDIKLAEDITQDTFIQVYNKAAFYKAGTYPKGWMITIAKNLSYDKLRKLDRNEFTDNVEKYQKNKIFGNNIERIDIINAFNHLSDTERQIVILKVISGFTHAEIARNLSIPEGTVKWKYKKGLGKLKGIIGDDENE